MTSPVVLNTNIPFLPERKGKVRDVYDLGDKLLIVSTDRISAYDCVMPNGIPDKGKILTKLSQFWFRRFGISFPNHFITAEVAEFPSELMPFASMLAGRSMLVKKAVVVPIECVARGYLAGSGWKEYQKSQSVCGNELPPGLRQCEKLPRPIFTPATKEESGHDENITFDQMVARVGIHVAKQLYDRTLALYSLALDHAYARGVIIADTKFEFGVLPDGTIILIDEVLTPDSSRFWPVNGYEPGHDQLSFDKQFVRNYLDGTGWDKTDPAPALPDDVVVRTRELYRQAYGRLTGRAFVA